MLQLSCREQTPRYDLPEADPVVGKQKVFWIVHKEPLLNVCREETSACPISALVRYRRARGGSEEILGREPGRPPVLCQGC